MAHIPLSNGKLPQTQPFPARKVRQRMRAGCVVARTVACCVRPVAPRGGGISSWRRLSSLPAYGMACRYYPALFRPFRACAISRSGPTALPWAILFRPVGASGGTVNRPRLAVVFFLPLYTSKLCLNVPHCLRHGHPASVGRVCQPYVGQAFQPACPPCSRAFLRHILPDGEQPLLSHSEEDTIRFELAGGSTTDRLSDITPCESPYHRQPETHELICQFPTA